MNNNFSLNYSVKCTKKWYSTAMTIYVSPFNQLFMIEVHGTKVASVFFTTGCF